MLGRERKILYRMGEQDIELCLASEIAELELTVLPEFDTGQVKQISNKDMN